MIRDQAVEVLIVTFKKAPKGSTLSIAVIEALGEAGGKAAYAALLTAFSDTPNPGTSYGKALIKALGRVGHTGE